LLSFSSALKFSGELIKAALQKHLQNLEFKFNNILDFLAVRRI